MWNIGRLKDQRDIGYPDGDREQLQCEDHGAPSRNSQSENNRATYTNTLANQKETVPTNVKNAYNSLVLAKDSYDQAKTSYDLAEKEARGGRIKDSPPDDHEENV